MKKTLLVVALATIIVFAFASTALASKGTTVQNVGNGPGTDSMADAVYISWSTLSSWGANPPASSPHGNYATATAKCQVCHAVHQAAPAGDTLLKMQASQACYTCHVDIDLTGKVVYGGDRDIAAASGDDHHVTGTNCYYCHASVHGSNAITDVASLTGAMLATNQNSTVMRPLVTWDTLDAGARDAEAVTGLTRNELETSETVKPAAVGLFCTGCHSGSYWTVNGDSASLDGNKTGHRVQAAANDDWNVGQWISSSSKVTGKVAWAPADDCYSCHDGDNGFGDTGFPHFTPYQSRFMKQGAYFGSTETTATSNYVGYSADRGIDAFSAFKGTGDTAGSTTNSHRYYSVQDGTCIKCHKGAADTGVGFSY